MKKVLRLLVICSVLVAGIQISIHAQTKVELIRTPDDGIQPQVISDPSGVVHLVYYQGDASSGEIYYQRKVRGGPFTRPLQVNSVSGSAVAMGTIRGAKFAVDGDGRVHVVWNGSRSAMKEGQHGPPMFYTRLNEDRSGFENQRIITGDWPVDGGGAIGVDSANRVFVFWHSGEEGSGDANRSIFTRVSRDGGDHFDEEKVISSEGSGVCGCCSMQAKVDQENNVYVLFRGARENEHRDINLLLSRNRGRSYEGMILDTWNLKACPMSSLSFAETDRYVVAGWETESRVRFAPLEKGLLSEIEMETPSKEGSPTKHPVFATSPKGELLVVWTEGTGWKKGGNLAWKQYDATFKSLGEIHRPEEEVPVWSFLAAYYDWDAAAFHILY